MSTLWCSSHKIFKNLFCAWECDVKAKCPLKWIEWMFSVLKKIKLKAHFQPWCNACRDPISYNMKFPDHWKPFQNRLSQEPSWTYSQLFYGKYIRRSSFYTFLTVFLILSGRIRRKFFFKCHAWISSYSVNRVGEKDNVQIFSLSRSAWGF